jgi:uncharacterized surface protein with fasciclin (FAS1) repeats
MVHPAGPAPGRRCEGRPSAPPPIHGGSPDDHEGDTPMKLRILTLAAILALAAPALAQERTKNVGGAPMFPSKTIVENAVNSKDHTTLVAAVKAAGLVDTLQMQGPFTVFAPTNRAFGKLPKGTVETLVKPENKRTLTGILTYHVVPGRLTARDLMAQVRQGGGQAMLKTVQGETLTLSLAGRNRLVITDAKGGRSTVTIPDVLQSNGVIHVVDTVLLPA